MERCSFCGDRLLIENEVCGCSQSIAEGISVSILQMSSGPLSTHAKQVRDNAHLDPAEVPAFIKPLADWIGKEVDRQLRYKVASQNLERLEEISDKLDYLIHQTGINPSAADIAMFKHERDKDG